MDNQPQIRVAQSEDQRGIFGLVSRVYDEYEYESDSSLGEKDLVSIQEVYFDEGGIFWVMENRGQIIGSHAALPTEKEDVCTFRRLYLHKEYRGHENGARLMQVAVDWARENDYSRIEFWSDLKFHRAHRFFEKFGFVRTEKTRSMHDGIQPFDEALFYLNL